MTIKQPHIVVLMAVHNRQEHTDRALRSLQSGRHFFRLSVVILDDASTDGTPDVIRSAWPEAIILSGDGKAFWNGGMHQAWVHALSLGADGYLWLNDDVRLDDDAIERMAQVWRECGGADLPFILVGPTRDDTGKLSYGGHKFVPSPLALRFERLPISTDLSKADTFNGNIVLISKQTVEAIGVNDPRFLHSLGDIDYGLRASRAGIPVLVLPGTLGVCNGNVPVPLNSGSLLSRLRLVQSHRGLPLKNWWRITRRYSGAWFILHFVLPYRKIFLPSKRP